MKIAYVTTYDSSNEHAWSGSGYYMCKALETNGCTLERIGNLRVKMDLLFKIKKAYYKFLLSKNYQKQREPLILRSYAQQISARLTNSNYDAILSPGTIPVSFLKTDRPIICWTDATFAGLVDFFPDFSNIPDESLRQGHEMEQKALTNCSLAIYTSDWAAKSALKHYSVDPKKIKVVPFGANLESYPDEKELERIISNKRFDSCKLLFIGVDWYRKGGDMAVRVAALLNERGVKTELHVVGVTPPGKFPDFITFHGFLSKKVKSEKEKIGHLFEASHFLIMPSVADCVPVVLAEANSYGLPCLTTDIGGMESAITNNVNGHTFSLHADPELYSNFITTSLSSRDRYLVLVRSSYMIFRTKMNWEVAGLTVRNLIEKL